MRYARVLWVIGFTTAASVWFPTIARAQTTNTTSFGVDLVQGTVTYQTPAHTVLSVSNNLGIDGLIPQDLAQFITGGESSFGIPALGLPTFAQNNLSNFVGRSDLDFLTNADIGPGELLTVAGSLTTVGNFLHLDIPTNILDNVGSVWNTDAFPSVTADLTNGAPANAVLTSQTLTFAAAQVYLGLIGTGSDTSQVYEGDVVMLFFTENIVETVPEPSSLLLVTCGLALLACRHSRRRRSLRQVHVASAR